MIRLPLAILLLAGCGSSRQVDVTIVPSAGAMISSIEIVASGAEQGCDARGMLPSAATLRARYLPKAKTGKLTLTVTAYDATGLSIQRGSNAVLLDGGQQTMEIALAQLPTTEQTQATGCSTAPDLGGGDGGCSTTLTFCDDFETLADPYQGGTLDDTANIIGVDDMGYKSAHGLHVLNSGATEAATHLAYNKPPELQSDIWVRVWLWMPMPPANVDILEVDAQSGGASSNLSLHQNGTFFVNYESTMMLSSTGEVAFPFNTWNCVEWKLASGSGMSMVYLNGLEQISLRGPAITSAATILYGLNNSASSGNYEAYYDDIAFDGAQIGCGP